MKTKRNIEKKWKPEKETKEKWNEKETSEKTMENSGNG